MEIVQRELLLVGSLRVIAMAHIEDILLYVFLDDKPRTAAEAQSLTLSNGMIPQSLVLSDTLTRFQFDDISRQVT